MSLIIPPPPPPASMEHPLRFFCVLYAVSCRRLLLDDGQRAETLFFQIELQTRGGRLAFWFSASHRTAVAPSVFGGTVFFAVLAALNAVAMRCKASASRGRHVLFCQVSAKIYSPRYGGGARGGRFSIRLLRFFIVRLHQVSHHHHPYPPPLTPQNPSSVPLIVIRPHRPFRSSDRSRQLQNYQLLSDLSSDEEAASHRDSNHDLAARILSASRSFSPGKEAGGPAFSNDASAQLDRRKDEVAAPAVAPDPDVGAIEVSCSPTGAITSFSSSSDRGRRSHGVPTVIAKNATNAGVEASVGAISESTSMAVAPVDEGPALSRAASSLAKATESSNNSQEREEARSSILGGSGGGGVEAKGGEKEGENNQVGEHRKEEGEDDDKGGDGGGGDDGDEEDNADDGEGYDTVGEDGFGGSGGGGGGDVSCAGRAGEARVGDEGRWWWSWTWGALPVRYCRWR